MILTMTNKFKIILKRLFLMILTSKLKMNKKMIYLETLMITNLKNRIKLNKNKTCTLKINQIHLMMFYFE